MSERSSTALRVNRISAVRPLRFQGFQMLFRIEFLGYTAVDSFADRSFQLRQTALVLLQKPQAGPNNLAGIVITPLCDFCLDEILKINPEGYRCRFHNHAVFTQNYQYLIIKQNPGRIYCLGRDRRFGFRLFRCGSSSRETARR